MQPDCNATDVVTGLAGKKRDLGILFLTELQLSIAPAATVEGIGIKLKDSVEMAHKSIRLPLDPLAEHRF